MTTLWRTSALAERHHALGATLEDWNGMGTAFRYAGADTADHHAAIRTQAGLMDVSGLKKIHCVGPHAKVLLDHATTRDMSKLYPGKSVYATMLNEAGKFVDDCIVYCLAPNAYLVVHGTGLGQEMLTLGALGRNVSLMFDDDLHDLSLQGPLAVDFLEKHVESIRDLRYFHHLQTRLFGFDVMISRTGYTGERGYEIFCKAKDAPSVWDEILDKGAPMGIVPCGFETLDWLRVESNLLFYPVDNSETYPFPDQPAGDNYPDLDQGCGRRQNGGRREHRHGGALGIRAHVAGHAPYRLGDNRHGNHFEAVKDAAIDDILEGDDTVAEGNQGKGRRHGEAKPGGQRARQPGPR